MQKVQKIALPTQIGKKKLVKSMQKIEICIANAKILKICIANSKMKNICNANAKNIKNLPRQRKN